MSLIDEHLTIKIVYMHYKLSMSQQEIAGKLKLSRATVSRTLAKAKREGIVKVQIDFPEGSKVNMEDQLEKKYNLKEVIVTGVGETGNSQDEVAFFGADYLLRTLTNHVTVAMSRGTTIHKMIQAMANDTRLKFLKSDNIMVVPLEAANNVGLNKNQEYRMAMSNYLIDEMARILNGQSYQLLAPQFVSSGKVRDILMQEDSIKDTINMAASADLAVFGIGTVGPHSTTAYGGIITKEEFERLRRLGGVCEVAAFILDQNGNVLEDEFNERVVSLGMDRLKEIPIRVGLASGEIKKEAVLSAIRGGYVNILIIDADIASYLLDIE